MPIYCLLMQWQSSTLYGSSMSKCAFYAAWTCADFWYFRWGYFLWILGDLPLAISRKFAGSSAWYLCSSRGESLMKLVRSGEYLASRLSGRGKDLGKNQNGTAESRVMSPAIRYPSHQAPTQRASPGVMLMLSVRRQSHTHAYVNSENTDATRLAAACHMFRIFGPGRQSRQMQTVIHRQS